VEQEAVLKPRISILLPAPLGFETVRSALDSWNAQTRRDVLEILILCPEQEAGIELAAGQVIVQTGSRDLHEARAFGAMYATGEYVMLAEDHCLPDPDWTARMLDRLDEGWDAIGPALRPGNRTNTWAQGSFLIGYGEWMEPVNPGPIGVLCGWNVLIRTELVRERGDRLADDLILGSFLTRDMAREGRKFFLESRARMRHFDPPGGRRQMRFVCIVGLGFGAIRTATWPRLWCLLYPLGIPVIAALHFRRAARHYLRAGRSGTLGVGSLFSAAILAWAWAVGEGIGAFRGLAKVTPKVWVTEIKPVSKEAVAASDRAEQAMGVAPRLTDAKDPGTGPTAANHRD